MLRDEWREPDVASLSFGTGMHDDPQAGEQDFGGNNYVFRPDVEGGYR
jgi:hypothetical protein